MIHNRWYITAAAVRQYMAICGIEAQDEGDRFDAAAKELGILADASRLAQDVDEKNHTQKWRVKATVRGKRTRLELVVSVGKRQEGDLAQLIAVRNKGA